MTVYCVKNEDRRREKQPMVSCEVIGRQNRKITIHWTAVTNPADRSVCRPRAARLRRPRPRRGGVAAAHDLKLNGSVVLLSAASEPDSFT